MALDLTTLARVKTLLGEAGASQDALLGQLIAAVSARFEEEMRRHTTQAARTEVYPVKMNRRMLTMRGAPVDLTQPFSLKFSDTTNFSGVPTMVRNSDFVVEEEMGILRLITTGDAFAQGKLQRPFMPYYVQIISTSGMATSTANFITAYPEVAQACDLQVAYLFRRRTSPGGDVKVGDSFAQYTRDYNLLDEVRSAIWKHKRIVF